MVGWVALVGNSSLLICLVYDKYVAVVCHVIHTWALTTVGTYLHSTKVLSKLLFPGAL